MTGTGSTPSDAAVLRHLEALVAQPSVFTASDYTAITDYCETVLRQTGARCHRIASARPGRAGLFASLGPEGPGGVLLSGHLDVVPVDGELWTSDPFTLSPRDGRAYGRGAADMKGFVACALAAFEATAGNTLAAPLKLVLSFDEEAGCLGIAEMLPHLNPSIGLADLCIVGEPTEMRLVTGHKGKASYRVECYGGSGHSALAPTLPSALHMAADVIGILRRIQAELASAERPSPGYAVPHSTLHAGVLSGGVALNMVPERATLECELRYLPQNGLDETERCLLDEIAALADRNRADFSREDIGIEVTRTSHYPGLGTGLSVALQDYLLRLGADGVAGPVDFGTEAGYLAELGMPVVICGPGRIAQAHQPDEFVALDQLSQCSAMLDRLVDSLATGGPDLCGAP
ncbi:M20/M25/M40 family metallo-hydrolase [Nitratireductor aquimarinus]|uniref:M20/M25/M40 family metallo-hydrolase n=1 Tax=Nitratireductor aquimarinus TaxID=889300 RepID=UPI0029367B93|nr:M20/M25/M40 family metallo-hydrolase [Nitratireductor aquimarinus]MDV2968833.1 M20/M25/M40 family metallo-hydrolase [Nitratireductor aquimarinus]